MSVARDAYALFVGGKWRQALSGGTFGVTNPANGETVATLPDGGAPDMRAAIEAAARARRGWGRRRGGGGAGGRRLGARLRRRRRAAGPAAGGAGHGRLRAPRAGGGQDGGGGAGRHTRQDRPPDTRAGGAHV